MLRALALPRPHAITVVPLLTALVLLGGSQTASAGNGVNGLPTPVTWPQCAQYIKTVDRSVAPIVHIDSSFSGDDDLRESEVEPLDSRTHQLFATCRQRLRSEPMPRWITQTDYDTALAAFGYEAVGPVGPQDVLDLDPRWQGCAHRVNADDDRRPITLHQSLLGFDWDTRNVPEGSYVVEGYTLEPPHNGWSHSPHPGVYRIVDKRDPLTNPPAAVVINRSNSYYQGEAIAVEACVAAMPNSVIDIHWAHAPAPHDPNGELGGAARRDPTAIQWHPVALGLGHDPRAVVKHDFVPPPEATVELSNALLFRVTARDPQGRIHEAYSRAEIDVLNFPKPPPCTIDEEQGEEATGEDTDEDNTEGCRSLGHGSGAPQLLMAFAGLTLLLRRKRKD